MSDQLGLDFVSAPALRQAGRRQYVLRKVLEHRELFRAGFYEWMQDNLAVWEMFEHQADRVWDAGRRHYSARTLWEYMRHETAVRSANDGEWKLNDHWPPSCARLYMVLHPDRERFFETRSAA